MTDAAEQFPKLMQRYGLENVTLEGVHEHDPDDGCGEMLGRIQQRVLERPACSEGRASSQEKKCHR